jgi:hypothetical protein
MPLAKKVGDKPPATASASASTGVAPSVPNARADVAERVNNGVLRPGAIGGLKTYTADELTSMINVLIYGEPGVGKTLLAGSACLVPELCPVLYIDVEDGAKTLRGAYGNNPNLVIVRPRTFGKVQGVFDELVAKKGAGFKSCVFDNATEGQKVGIEYIFDGDTQSTDFTEFLEATWKNQGWNRSSEQMRKMIRYFKVLPLHTIFLAWRKDFSKPEEKVERWGPAFSNTLAGQVPGMFDSVFYYNWKKINNVPTRVLQTKGTDTVVAKDRDGGHKLPDTIVDPTMAKLCEMWGYV